MRKQKVKQLKRYLKLLPEVIFLLFVLAVFVFSLFKVINYIRLTKFVGGASAISFPLPPLPPDPPCPPPCPPPHPPGCPTPTSPPEPTPTPPPEITPTPTPTLPPGITPTPTPTSPPGEGGPPGPAQPPVCGATIPSAPTLLSATKRGGETDLSWTAVDPVTHYAISYGLSSGNYIYGLDNTGNVTSFTVGGLDSAADYCFAVRAVNDCAPGLLSNEICTGEVLGVAVGEVLGVTTLADTGTSPDELLQILFIIGSVCTSIGLKLALPAKRLA